MVRERFHSIDETNVDIEPRRVTEKSSRAK